MPPGVHMRVPLPAVALYSLEALETLSQSLSLELAKGVVKHRPHTRLVFGGARVNEGELSEMMRLAFQ